jgi:hypothetical protein
MTGKIGRMGLLDKLFRNKETSSARLSAPPTSQFQESQTTTELSSNNAPRRELVQVVLRDTMRKHGIPSDWIECRILSVVSNSRGSGMHVQFVVRSGDDRLITYVHAFQHSFMRELEQFEPKAADWIFSLSWQFDGKPLPAHAAMPDPKTWGGAKAAGAPSASASAKSGPAAGQDADLKKDLEALFAIRDAVLKDTAAAELHEDDHPEFAPTQPGFAEDFDKKPPRR